MSTRAPKLRLALVLGAAAYGLGWLLGQPVSGLWNRHNAGRIRGEIAQQAPLPTAGEAGRVHPLLAPAYPEASAFLPEPGQAFQILNTRLLDLDRSRLWNPGRQETELTPLLRFIRPEKYSEIWNSVRRLKSRPLQQGFGKAFIATWAKVDPRAALTALMALADSGETRPYLDIVLKGWGEQEPQAALAWAQQVPDARRERALAAVVSGMANTAPSTAAECLHELPPGRGRDAAALSVLRALAPVDVEAAAALVTNLEWRREDFHQTTWPEQKQAISEVARAWAQQSLPNALAWAQSLPESEGNYGDTAFSAIFGRLIELQQPELAVEAINSLADDSRRDRLTERLAGEWSSRDLPGAATWISQMPAGRMRGAAWRAMRWIWIPEDPQGAVDFALRAMPSGESRAAVLEDIAKVAIKTMGDDYAVRGLADHLAPGPDRDTVLKVLSDQWRWCPQEAASLVASMSPGETQSEQAASIAGRWAVEDPASAAAWVAAFPTGKAREEAMRRVLTQWGYSDPAASAQWLEGLPADTARAQGADLFVSNLADRRPDLAGRMVTFIPEESRRNQQIERILCAWWKTDPGAARTWLEQAPLPPDRKSQVLNSVSSAGPH